MSYRDLQPLPADIAALLGAERRAPRPSTARETAIYARIEAAVGAASAVTAASALGADASGRVAGLARGAAATKGIAATVAPASKALLATVALVAGGVGAGAAAYLAVRVPHRPPSITVPADVKPSAGSPRTLPPVVPLATEPPPALAPPPAAVDERMRAAAADLVAESALLEHARQALARGAPEVALGDVRQHARRFAAGHMIEERDALWIKALCASGRGNAARARAAAFRKHFPHSIQREAIERAIRELP